jgi:hypothetical protein
MVHRGLAIQHSTLLRRLVDGLTGDDNRLECAALSNGEVGLAPPKTIGSSDARDALLPTSLNFRIPKILRAARPRSAVHFSAFSVWTGKTYMISGVINSRIEGRTVL